jgi:phosphoglycolate phosphatase-like HAD superfamily hydrolase
VDEETAQRAAPPARSRQQAAPPAHVVWDWNGTLLDDLHLVVDAASAACWTVGRGPVTPEEYRACFVRPIERSYERLLGRPLADGEWERLTAVFHSSYERSLSRAALAPDARQALAAVARSGRTQSLLSMWTHDQLVPLVEAFGIAGWFVRIDGQPTFGGGRKETHMRRHLDALGAGGDDVLIVGDSLDDADAARAVGAP